MWNKFVFDGLLPVAGSVPANIVVLDDNNVRLDISAPGYGRENLTVEREATRGKLYLTVTGKKSDVDERYKQRQFARSDFRLSYSLHPDSQIDSVTYTDGILSILVNVSNTKVSERLQIEVK